MTWWLAFDGGATQTAAGWYDAAGNLLAETRGDGCNPLECGLPRAAAILAELGQRLLGDVVEPGLALAGISGAADAEIQAALAGELCRLLPIERAVVTTDLHPVLWANLRERPGILVIAGTGSSVLAQNGAGRLLKVGGRGPVLGDEGSAWAVAVSALHAAARRVDGIGPATQLPELLAKAAGLDRFDQFPGWAAAASKRDLAALGPVVVAAAADGDAVAQACLDEQADRLAAQAEAARERLQLSTKECPILMHGGFFEHSLLYSQCFAAALGKQGLPAPEMVACRGHQAVIALARLDATPEWAVAKKGRSLLCGTTVFLPATERRAVLDKPLDTMTAPEIVRVMSQADHEAADAVARQGEPLAALMDAAAQTIRQGGRILYVGAGTSGRLGVLDASECPPTFGVNPGVVVGLIAGGDRALRHSVEAAEDRAECGAADLEANAVAKDDLVIGIAASGTTPYVLGALDAARRVGARTALLCCNPAITAGADLVIAFDTGPEVLAGSTRLKAGTATKMALNMTSTGAMALSGHLCEGLMVGMKPTNAKLRQRAVRIIATLAQTGTGPAERLLDAAGGNIAVAVIMARQHLDRAAAEARLNAAGGILRTALEESRCAAKENRLE
jgi:N-acetylmuramic acid 6-phosphate etherase